MRADCFALLLCVLARPEAQQELRPPSETPAAAGRSFLQKTRRFLPAAAVKELEKDGVRFSRKPRCPTSSGTVLLGSSGGIVSRDPDGALEPFPSGALLPWSEVTVIAEEAPGVVWIGTTRGAVRCDSRSGRTRSEYFAGRRWLPHDRVTGLGMQPSRPGRMWVETPSGLSLIEHRPLKLAAKARLFERRLRARHVRYGLVSESVLRRPGETGTSQLTPSDNDGLWTAMYVAAEAFRHAATGEEEARRFARESLEALLRLETITGIPGFPARSFIRAGDEQPEDGEWHPTPDGEWVWKGDTSSDEIVGHYFAWSVYHDLVADDPEKKELAATVERVTSHIVDNGFRLIDVDGEPTRWGWWDPERIWSDPDETGLRALEILSHLRVAHHITGESRFLEVYRRLVEEERYALLTLHQKIQVPGHVNHSDDGLAFLSWYPLLRHETDPELRRIYIEGLERSWRVERPERNPLWSFIYCAGTGRVACDAGAAIETLERIPLDLVRWNVTNSHRGDVMLSPHRDRFGRPQALQVLPPDERPLTKWNANPYLLDGGHGGNREDDGAFFLLPYWMGRYHGMLSE